MSARSVKKPWWQQATALVTVTTGGVITGFSFVPGAASTMTSPASVPLHLLALQKAASGQTDSGDAALRSAIVNVAGYYLRLAKTNTPAQMEAMIWGRDSVDGADHGPSCAAFASLTLELAAQAAGKQSWVTGGSTYPWPLHEWADVRVDPNPDSLAITSIVQDAQAHDRWHPLGDGYAPQPGDWVLFSGHVEVVTSYADGVLDTIGADSLPNLTVNAHSFPAPLADQGVAGFVDNGHLEDGLPPATAQQTAQAPDTSPASPKARVPKAQPRDGRARAREKTDEGLANIPGSAVTGNAPAAERGAGTQRGAGAQGTAAIPGVVGGAAGSGGAAASGSAAASGGAAAGPYRKYAAPEPAPTPQTRTQQAFISAIAPGAIAAQQRYGVPASVTIAQAIDESEWGQSQLALRNHNLFGIKGTGPAGSVELPTRELTDGRWVTVNAAFRVYHNNAESIADHAELLATSGYYQQAMADRTVPDAFANDLTGIYATDPEYGANLIALMRLYNLYRFDSAQPPAPVAQSQAPAAQAPTAQVPAAQGNAAAAQPHAPAAGHAPAVHALAPGSAAIPGATPVTGAATGYATARGNAHTPGYAAVPGYAGVPGSEWVPVAPVQHGAPAPHSAPVQHGAPVPHGAPVQRGAAGRASAGRPRASRAAASAVVQGGARIPGLVAPMAPRYQAQLPGATTTAFFTSAKTPLARAEPLYRDVAGQAGIRWELLAACDWMQCQAHPRYSPVHGEKIGMPNSDGTVYATKSEALAQCAADLIELAAAVYRIDLTSPRLMSVRALADAFAAFRWGALLRRHRVSAMEFPYSVAGLTAQHLKMHWPAIDEPDAPDKPGGRFRMPFGAVPVVLSLNYPATVLDRKRR